MLAVMKLSIHFDTEHEFRTWFELNLSEFGIEKIIVNQEVCPDYVVDNGNRAN